MSVITPTITTEDPHEYRIQMDIVKSYADGVHLDFADGIFAPTRLLPIEQAWRDEDLITHAHIMYKNPFDELANIIKLDPDLAILHVESEKIKECLEKLSENGTRTGLAFLASSPISIIKDKGLDSLFDHILLFGGHLGYQGGSADLSVLDKVKQIKVLFPDVEISWDGGVNQSNAKQISEAGVNVLNVGGYLRNSKEPKKAYAELVSLVS